MELWNRVSAIIGENYSVADDPEDFLSKWNILSAQMYANLPAFTNQEALTTVPRTLLNSWQELQLRPFTKFFHYTEFDFVEYLNRVLNPNRTNLWEDMTDTMEEVYQDYILDQTEELANIRKISSDTDGKVINLTANEDNITREPICQLILTYRLPKSI